MNSFDAIMSAIENFAADLLFGVIVLAGFGIIMLAVLFASLAIRSSWHWLMCKTWGDAITSVERRAFHGRVTK